MPASTSHYGRESLTPGPESFLLDSPTYRQCRTFIRGQLGAAVLSSVGYTYTGPDELRQVADRELNRALWRVDEADDYYCGLRVIRYTDETLQDVSLVIAAAMPITAYWRDCIDANHEEAMRKANSYLQVLGNPYRFAWPSDILAR